MNVPPNVLKSVIDEYKAKKSELDSAFEVYSEAHKRFVELYERLQRFFEARGAQDRPTDLSSLFSQINNLKSAREEVLKSGERFDDLSKELAKLLSDLVSQDSD